ncbi:MAG: hypothetical protein H6660_06240 [Ardenticatenaceae bacterium]|nr:hypothetical protein [Ardenticatenaceae bacterium]
MTDSSCTCSECQAMCQRRPCWPTPTDAEQLMAAGYGDQLMLDWWFDREQNTTIYLLTPAIVGSEGGQAPAHPFGPCTFLDEANLCRLHNMGLKPTEGKQALCQNQTPPGLHEDVGRTWHNDTGRTLIDRWENSEQPRGRRRALQTKPTRRKKEYKYGSIKNPTNR